MKVTFSGGSYEVDFGSLEQVASSIPGNSYLITDRTVADLFPQFITLTPNVLILPAGEETKSLEWFGKCLNWLAKSGATRGSQIVALGGGVIGDLVGYVAASYMRGISYFQVPTTLLAQVDSSVGGKVAVDLIEGKNLAGAFYPPLQVWICSEFLQTLPPRQWKNGMAEVLKYGFICRPKLLAQGEDAENLVRQCIEIKADIVQKDEFETTGLRATLNFGHTIGHAMEKTLGYRSLLHGEAISVGMFLESKLGEVLGVSEKGTSERVGEVLVKAGLPTSHEVLARPDELIQTMYRDKKATYRSLTFSLLLSVGDCKIIHNVEEVAVREVLALG